MAIGITTNFINRHSRAEVEVAEISGVARIYNQKFFQNLYNKTGQWSQPLQGGHWGLLSPPEGAGGSAPGCPQWWGAFPHMVPHCRGHLVSEPGAGAPCGPGSAPSPSPGIDLENIVYYKDDTHYFVMTAKKQSLLKKGVILQVRRAGSGPGIPQQWAPESLESGMQIVDAGLHSPGGWWGLQQLLPMPQEKSFQGTQSAVAQLHPRAGCSQAEGQTPPPTSQPASPHPHRTKQTSRASCPQRT